ncbi:hypothetical protein ACWD04_32710 [Streptomyces sp. NPDC002911]
MALIGPVSPWRYLPLAALPDQAGLVVTAPLLREPDEGTEISECCTAYEVHLAPGPARAGHSRAAYP